MKTILLCSFLALTLPAFAQNAAPVAPSPKDAAVAINGELNAMLHGADSSDARWQAVDAEIAHYQKQFGVTDQTTHNVVLLRRTELYVAKKSGNAARYDALVQKLAADPLPAVSALVAKIADLKTKPLDLKFTAVDGRAVDLANLRGKVVLVDFWATWCPDCVTGAPGVVAAYKKYHDQGFEIVGVSLDKDKDALTAFTQSHGMDWPQYFDGQEWKSPMASEYQISSIPAMWLVDKHGMVTTMAAQNDLDAQVSKLLAAP